MVELYTFILVYISYLTGTIHIKKLIIFINFFYLGELEQTKRTAKIHVGVTSKKDNSFRGIHYSKNYLINYDDKNYTHYGPEHPQLDGIMYWDKLP